MKIKLKIYFAFLIVFLFSTINCFSNNEPVSGSKEKTIILSGKIIDFNKNELLAGVSITTTDVEKTTYSDLNGNFFIYLKIKDSVNFKLEFSQIGYISKTLYLSDLTGFTSNLEINLEEE